MITDPIHVDDIRYNPASACFEAKVTVHGAGPARVYACDIEGDMALDLSALQTSLRADAIRRHMTHTGLYSSCSPNELRPMHTPKRATAPLSWITRLPAIARLRAA